MSFHSFKKDKLSAVKGKKGLLLVYLNSRSIFHKIDLIKLDFLDKIFNFVGIGETWLKPSFPNSLFCNDAYKLVRKDRTVNNKKGGGVCLFIKTGIFYEELLLLDLNDVSTELEWVCVKANVGGHKPQIILCIYRPPGGSPATALGWLRTFLDYITDNHNNAELTIIGDFNFNYWNSYCPHVKSLKMIEQICNVKQLITDPTRSNKNNSTLIDLCFSNMTNIQGSGVIDYHLSDHCPIYIQKKKLNKKIKNQLL